MMFRFTRGVLAHVKVSRVAKDDLWDGRFLFARSIRYVVIQSDE